MIAAIKADVSAATAKSCRSVISGVMGLAVRYGAVMSNPVREVERIEARPKREPRALTMAERVELLQRLQADEKAQRRDLPDLVFFMLATGVRIGEALAVVWSQVDFEAGTVPITSTLVRVKGEGFLRKGDQESGGGADAAAPGMRGGLAATAVHDRSAPRQPLFPDVNGGFRDPANVWRELRGARGKEALAWISSHSFRKPRRRPSTRPRCRLAWSRTSSATAGPR